MSNVLPINRQYPRDEKVLVRGLDGQYAAFPEGALKQAHPERGQEGPRSIVTPLLARLQKITVTRLALISR